MLIPDSHARAEELAASVARMVPGLDPVWRRAIADVPWHLFLPERIRVDGTAVDRRSEPAAWWQAAYADPSVTTAPPVGDPRRTSAPPVSPARALAVPWRLPRHNERRE